MIKPFFNAKDSAWVTMVGRYMLNIGVIEMTTRIIIFKIEGSDKTPLANEPLTTRISFLRKRFPRENKARHQRAMKIFETAKRHSAFRNIVAHSPLALTDDGQGGHRILGI